MKIQQMITVLARNNATGYRLMTHCGGTLFNWVGELNGLCIDHDQEAVMLNFSGESGAVTDYRESGGRNLQIFVRKGNRLVKYGGPD